jgi:hypothetical protein
MPQTVSQLPRSILGGAQVTKSVFIPLATIATTGSVEYTVPAPAAGTFAGATLVAKDALAASDSNYLTITLTNKGQAGAGSTALLAASPVNTTKATGGAAIAAYTKYALTKHATAANLLVAQDDCLALGIAATGTLANTVTEGCVRLDFTVAA